MKILITGSSGLLGGTLSHLYSARHDISAVHFTHTVNIPQCKNLSVDIRDSTAVERLLANEKPQILIHCAANTNVDYCESHPKEAYLLNAQATKTLAEHAQKLGVKMIYISTDSVFKQERTEAFSETDQPSPSNVYATTKREGELAVETLLSDYLIVRTCIIGFNILQKLCLTEWIIEELSNGHRINGFTDIFFTPILVNDIADALLSAIENKLTGTYHIASRDSISKYDFSCQLAQRFGFSTELIRPSSIKSSELRAFRPKRPCLDVSKFEKAINVRLPTIEDGIKRFLELQRAGFKDRLKSFNTQSISAPLINDKGKVISK